ncbi:MAG: HAD family hydrolase [Eubacteriales bacterium]|nr:HAD family hydrolase [Eubacteriales bacterium]
MIDAVIFDLDGTIADTIADLADACNFALKKAGFPTRPVSDYVKLVGHGRKNLLLSAAPEGRGEACIDELIADFNLYYREHFFDKTQAYDGMKEVVTELKATGCRLGILSNKPHEMTVPIVAKLYPGLFDCVMGQLPDMPVKPDRRTIDLLVEKMGVAGGRIAVVGDSDVDILTARNAGAAAIAVTWGYRPAETLKALKPDRLVKTPAALLRALRRLG